MVFQANFVNLLATFSTHPRYFKLLLIPPSGSRKTKKVRHNFEVQPAKKLQAKNEKKWAEI